MKVVLENLTKKFPNRNKKIKTEVVAVDNFTFEIPDGKLIGLLGPSGCGKSTLLNILDSSLELKTNEIYAVKIKDILNVEIENGIMLLEILIDKGLLNSLDFTVMNEKTVEALYKKNKRLEKIILKLPNISKT